MLQDQWVDLLLLDVNMPVMNGEEQLRRIRSSPETAALPVIVVSTEGSETRLAALHELGCEIVRDADSPSARVVSGVEAGRVASTLYVFGATPALATVA